MALINVIADETIPDVRPEVTGAMVGALATQKTRDWVVACTLRVPRKAAAALLYNHSHQDWRDLIRRIRLPTLVIAGRASNVSWRSQMWIANTIPGAQVRVFEKEAGGSHFMFLEAPDEFSRVLMEFLS